MLEDPMNTATERINAGEQIPEVSPSAIEKIWTNVSRIPKAQRKHVCIGIEAVAVGQPELLESAEQQVAMMTRYMLLDALLERGILAEYMEDEPLRQKVFAAAASIPCDKNDLGEAMAEKVLGDATPEQRQEMEKAFSEAGYDPDHLKIADKFLEWMANNS